MIDATPLTPPPLEDTKMKGAKTLLLYLASNAFCTSTNPFIRHMYCDLRNKSIKHCDLALYCGL